MSLQITEALPQFVEHARLSVAELYYEVHDSVPRRPRLSLSRVEAEKCEDEKALRKWARRVVSDEELQAYAAYVLDLERHGGEVIMHYPIRDNHYLAKVVAWTADYERDLVLEERDTYEAQEG